MYKVCADGMIRRCLPDEEYKAILHHYHYRETGGHFRATRTIAKFYNQVFIGQPYLKFPICMSLHVIDVKRHVTSLEKKEMPLNYVLVCDIFYV